MHNRGYGYYDADPTQPTDVSSLPHGHFGGTGAPQPYSTSQTDWSQGFDSRYSYPPSGASSAIYQGLQRFQGTVGELPSGAIIRTTASNASGVQQRVARMRIGGSEASSSSQPGQLQVYRKPEAFRSQGGKAIGQYNLQPQRSNIGQISSQIPKQSEYTGRGPVVGGPPSNAGGPSASSQFSGPYPSFPPASRGGYQQSGGPSVGNTSMGPVSGIHGSTGGSQVGYTPQSTYSSSSQQYQQPLIGRMASSASASGVVGRISPSSAQLQQSPFVPASAALPSIPGRGQSKFIEELDSDELAKQMSTGNLSALESISQFGSMSQIESPLPPSQQGASKGEPPKRIKAVCSSGGHFVKMDGGGLEYKGGETRLVQIPNNCQHIVLLEALERLAGFGHSSGESTETMAPALKYQLPTEPNVYVDLVDDEDTQLMFDEWHDFSTASNQSTAKLHLFVDWLRRGTADQKQRRFGDSVASLEQGKEPESQSAGSNTEVSADDGRNQQSSTDFQDRKQTSQDSDIDRKLKERMEVIRPQEITLVKFLGSGGYGEVYLGKWQHSEAAIKCLNPSLFFTGGPASKAAMEELKKEAALLGSLRHPNVVWVYGIVLPDPKPQTSDSEDSASDGSDNEAPVPRGRNVPHHVRPPAMVTEYMSQGSVKMALQRRTDIVKGSLMRILIAMDAAKGMEYLHSKNIVHFDLKSANLLLGWRDRRAICKVADFGLSKQKQETFVSNVSSQRGTLPWIAPEIIKNPNSVNEKVDVFSFGVVLWELWTGKEPYDGLNYHALYHQMTTSTKSLRPALPGSPDWDPSVGPEPAPGYQALMERCWLESPYGRPSFNQVVKALKDMATSLRPAKKPKPAPSASSGQYTVPQGR